MEDETQFAAATILTEAGYSIVTFRGTDDTLAGWKEDLDLFITKNPPSYALALDYIEELASKREVGALVLEAPFLSAPRVVTRKRLLFVDPFPNLKNIKKVTCPVLIMHGTDDRVVPFWHGRELSGLAKKSVSVRFVPVEGADHGEIASGIGIDKYLEMVSGACEVQADAKSQTKTEKEGSEKGR